METVRVALLVISTITMGLVGGLFYGFSVAVVRALARVDDRTFVLVCQKMNRAIENGLFALSFVGTVIFSGISLVLFIAIGKSTVYVPIIVALVLYVLSLLITFRISIPMNNAIDRVGDPDKAKDLAGARKAFEAPWNRWNHIRGLLAIAGFGALCWALIEYGAL
ncbi:DUF1772 domain-containing protein [Actinocrispum wychmicini]|uniref:Putative membrane protein n=1 Tax=Actinocrispum wychmicini TaxID=1213861 RepID=A0A4R2J4X1_9PSEU|nr:DUF1772 domain-containing protein [Actinocrispum wychmicini]TCO52342.1 putative membrane protein [Actinocrispum wychmicini]